ncbi:MAG: hypothetical protein IMZ44_02460 [Planctomycetes bacterium]|nr:hypothetical protein [Planctomycetota bacterium]
MTPVARIVSDLFMMVLSILAVPSDVKEFRLDLIQHSGQVETVLVRRSDAGFTWYDEQKGEQLVERGTIRPAADKKDVYLLKLDNAPEQTFDFPASLKDFSLEGLRKATRLDLKATDGVVIYVRRSGGAVYLTPQNSRTTYACH